MSLAEVVGNSLAEGKEPPPIAIGKKFANFAHLSFTYTDGGRWHTAEFTCGEMLNILNTGMVDGKQICALEIMSVEVEGSEPVTFIYDFVLKATGIDPWRMN